jgi:hypothetical protein
MVADFDADKEKVLVRLASGCEGTDDSTLL